MKPINPAHIHCCWPDPTGWERRNAEAWAHAHPRQNLWQRLIGWWWK